uniref:C2H2-type domain-containing protein n=1 Tax=Oryza punctata TaxID=4537 RepID=A0A0E0KM76_ORYPU
MALSTLLLPSSSSSSSKTATATDTSDRRRHHHHNHTKRKKKPPPSLSPTPRTPPSGSGSHRAMAASSKKSTKQVVVAAKTGHHPKKAAAAAAAPTMPSRGAPSAAASVSSWEQLKSLLSCRSATAAARVHDPAAPSALSRLRSHGAGACGASLCAIRDVVDAASSAASTAAVSVDRDTTPLTRSSRRAHRAATSGGGHHASLRGLSGCYECRAINVEPMSRRYPRPRELCACSQCGEVFTKADSLEHHQAIRHAVSELGPEDSGRNIVEIIFKSSWQKRDRPICQIDRILKVHNAPRTVARFEAYRDAGCRAMLVCRVIAGRVRRNDDGGAATAAEDQGAFDSVAGDEAASSVYGNLEELFVANPRAILPCFVVIYRVAE